MKKAVKARFLKRVLWIAKYMQTILYGLTEITFFIEGIKEIYNLPKIIPCQRGMKGQSLFQKNPTVWTLERTDI
jgi:hypothetical protein